ncbi:MAG: hypothetical protein AB7U26_10660 [Sulfuricurvum sp.]
MNRLVTLYRTPLMAAALLLVALSALLAWNGHTRYEEALDTYRTVEFQTSEYKALHEKLAYDPASERIVLLKAHPKLIRSEKTRSGVLFEFSPLSAAEFDTISNKILNSPFVIKKLLMKHDDNHRGTIIVEFEG